MQDHKVDQKGGRTGEEKDTLHIIVNPVAGPKTALVFIQEEVLPLLREHGVPWTLHETHAVRDAGRIGKKLKALGVRRVAIAGGDGTAHELIEGVLAEGHAQWQLILLPLGTANALYSSLFRLADPQDKLHSLRAFLKGDEPKALPITTTNITSLAPIHSHVVASFALHAAILRDSETMREKYPGVERFKMAAHKNAGVFFDADVDLLPTRDGHVLRYDPPSAEFKATVTHLTGPFAYFLATATTPRLEPTFVIAPLLERMPPSSPSMDIIIIRPMNDPAIASLEPEERGAKWAERAWEVLGWAYKEGGHVDLTYGDQLESRGDGPVVVETFRCGGFKWTPKSSAAHTFCADGSLHEIPAGGCAVAQLSSSFAVWA